MGLSLSADANGSANIRVDVVESVLATLKVDAVVNSSNTALLLDYGGMSKALIHAAGRGLQEECAKKYPNGIEFGKIAITGGHKLPCKVVFHVALPEWGSKYMDASQALQMTVLDCLNLAESRGMKSIAFPALGCGFLGYPYDFVAQTMNYCLNNFKVQRKSAILQKIIVCIWPKGLDWKHIKEAFSKETHEDRKNMPYAGAPEFLSTCIREDGSNSCEKILDCGHICRGYKDEQTCPPCLKRNCRARDKHQTEHDDCIICYSDPLYAAPVIKLQCGHIFHLHCVTRILENRWVGARITFNFTLCPLCKAPMQHPGLKEILDPIDKLYEDVERKALMRLQYEGLQHCPEILNHSSPYFNNHKKYAMERYCYYPCFQCKKPYFGGAAQCNDVQDEHYKSEELVCPGCSSPQSKDQVCSKHGTEFIEFKCRYCCSIAVYFCFGTTHFCDACHSRTYMLTSMGDKLPKCPAGPLGKQLTGPCPLGIQHPPNGIEVCLGCGLCSNLQTF